MANLSKQSQQEEYRELTIASLVLGVVIGAIMTCAFVYIGLKLGFTMGGSTVAAILGFAVLRGAMGKGSIIENNINQTVASGVNNASAGIVFTLPALFCCPRPTNPLKSKRYLPSLQPSAARFWVLWSSSP